MFAAEKRRFAGATTATTSEVSELEQARVPSVGRSWSRCRYRTGEGFSAVARVSGDLVRLRELGKTSALNPGREKKKDRLLARAGRASAQRHRQEAGWAVVKTYHLRVHPRQSRRHTGPESDYASHLADWSLGLGRGSKEEELATQRTISIDIS